MSEPSLSEQYKQYCEGKFVEYAQEHPDFVPMFNLCKDLQRLVHMMEVLKWTSR